jgi:4-carboxymuconolactone decarboxylase
MRFAVAGTRGYPAALEALRAATEVWPGRPRPSREGGPARWRRRGAALCRRVYGPVYPRLVRAVRQLHPDLAAWMVDTGYGRVLSRPGLSARARELITVASLAAMARERQLVSHLLGASRVGAGRVALRRAIRAGARAGRERVTAGRAWREAFGARVDRTRTSP